MNDWPVDKVAEPRTLAPSRAIVVLPIYPWPATSGTRVRTAAIVNSLRRKLHVHVLALDRPGTFSSWNQAAAAAGHRRLRRGTRLIDTAAALAHGRHVVLERALAAGLDDALGQVAREDHADLVVLWRPLTGSMIQAARSAGACVVVDADESHAPALRSILRSAASWRPRSRAAYDLVSTRGNEARDFRLADQVWVSSNVERVRVTAALPRANVVVVPNAAPGPIRDAAEPGPVASVAFVGSYGYGPNEEAARYLARAVMPLVRAQGGPRRLLLVGPGPTDAITQLAEWDPEIQVSGQVDDVAATLREAGLLVAPIRSGGGTSIKVLDAMRAGVPVVTSSFVARRLEVVPGRHVIVADEAVEIANAVVRIRAERALRERLTAQALEFVRERHGPHAIDRAISDALTSLPGPVSDSHLAHDP